MTLTKIFRNLKIIEVFKTNVQTEAEAEELLALVHNSYFDIMANFDLDDCDKVLRVKGSWEDIKHIPALFIQHGFQCETLPD